MDTATVTYLGGLSCASVHTLSGDRLVTDAPPDNQGKGEAHSPTDLLCVSLCTCILTTMGISAKAKNIPFERAKARVVKHMANDPRRVARIEMHIELDAALNDRQRLLLERIAQTCPVSRSLHPDVLQEVNFAYV